MVLKLFFKNFINIFFSVSIILGLYIAISDYLDQSSDLFMTFIGTSAFLYFVQLILIYLKNKESRNLQISFLTFFKFKSIINLVIIPIVSSIISFTIGVNGIALGEGVGYIIISAFILVLTFQNLQTSIRNDEVEGFEVDESFDLLKLFSIFLLTLLTTRIVIADEQVAFSTIAPLLAYVFFIALTVAIQFKNNFMYTLLVCIIITIIFTISLSGFLQLNITQNIEILFSLYQTILFYVFVSILQQSQESSITWRGISKYLAILISLFLVIFYLAY